MLSGAVRQAMEGIYPAHIVTVSSEGIPNVSLLSEVWYVDERHVALSNQFFNKTKANLAANANALVRLISPEAEFWDLRVRYLRTETSGEVFDQMVLKLAAIASLMGMTEIFRLNGADIYEVLSVRHCTEYLPGGGA